MKQSLTVGIVSGETNEEYHSRLTHLSSTGLREFKRSPAHYQAYITEKREPTSSMFFGTNFHELIGEPQLFAAKYTKGPRKEDFSNLLVTVDDITNRIKSINPDAKPAKKKADAIKLLLELDPKALVWDKIMADFQAANAGKTILAAEDYDRLDGMLYSVLKSKTVLHLLTNGKAEQSIYWKDKTGVMCRCRPDWLREDGIVVDLKTTQDASKQGFKKAVRNYNYDLTSAFYLRGISHVLGEPITEFVHVAVESAAPFAVASYTIPDSKLQRADEEIDRLLEQYAECQEKNEWPAYPDTIQNLDDWE